MKKLYIILLSFILVGCNNNVKEEIVAVNTDNKSYKEISLYNVYKQDSYNLKKYEPEKKIYTGVFIEQKEGDFIKEFEKYTEVKNSVYIYNQKLDESYPLSWVLNCYSNGKTPFITILPPKDTKNLFNKNILKNLAKDFGNLQIPMFVNIYPANKKFLDNNNEYIKFLQDAKNYFELYAPNVAMVWSINKDIVYDINKLYPGDSYVDWVGLNIYEDVRENSKMNIMFKEFDFLYKKFEKKKPIFINLALSHFSNFSYNYVIDDKIKELNRYFNEIPLKYNRLKMINYINYDTFKVAKVNKQNYLLTDNKKILEAYKKVLNNDIFSDTVIFADNSREIKEEYLLNCLAYKIGEDFFVDDKYFKVNKINIDDIYLKNSIDIDNKRYYNLNSILKNSNKKANIDEENKKILIN